MCRTNLNFEVDFGVNGGIGTLVTKWDKHMPINVFIMPIQIFWKQVMFPS